MQGDLSAPFMVPEKGDPTTPLPFSPFALRRGDQTQSKNRRKIKVKKIKIRLPKGLFTATAKSQP